jgi:uncharacterized protein YidB (DUF937 family)
MARGYPSLTALLGLLAIAGYQNRDKIAEMLGGLQGRGGTPAQGNRPGAAGNVPPGLDHLLGGVGAGGIGGLLSGGLRDLVDSFKKAGQGEVADSWVGRGPNKEVTPRQVEQAISPEVLEALSRETGLSHDELLTRLSRELPGAVDRYTPEGRIPSEAELARS